MRFKPSLVFDLDYFFSTQLRKVELPTDLRDCNSISDHFVISLLFPS